MSNKRWQKLKFIFSKALELEGLERKNYVENACGTDSELLNEVESLLKAHDEPGPLDQSLETLKTSVISDSQSPGMTGKRIGPYRIVRELGHGGMGIVYLAERADGEFDRRVALKLLRSSFASKSQILRFKQERQILASLEHDNIARLLDGGVTDQGQPFYVMEFVDGKPVDEYCDEHRLTVKKRLKLFLNACNAVQYAHRKLVVHRDLKPSNILIKEDGTVKLLDFGIAKVLSPKDVSVDQVPVTQSGLLPLTPAYASPEQVRGEQVTTASDIYQLGLVLYELLTGYRPYEVSGRSPGEIERLICDENPTRPSTVITKIPSQGEDSDVTLLRVSNARRTDPDQLKKGLRGDLDTMILKALRKEPERRYESAEQFASDITLYLSGRPVGAHPDSKIYRVKKFIRRHKISVASAVALAFLLIGYAFTITWHSQQTQSALARAQQETVRAEQALSRAEALQVFLLDLFRAAEPDQPRDQLPTTDELLALGAERAMDPESASPEERFEILLAIAGVYSYHSQPAGNEIARLLDTAINLAREEDSLRPEDLARALQQRAQVLILSENRLDEAEEKLLEAESLISEPDDFLADFAKIRISRSWLEQFRGNPGMALELLEEVYENFKPRLEEGSDTESLLYDRLASLYNNSGDMEKASHFRSLATDRFRRYHGEESRPYAVSLANSVSMERDLGRFAQAEANARKAISLYDDIYEEPSDYRASARLSLAETLFLKGRTEEAFEKAEQANREWAEFAAQELENWISHYIVRGRYFMRLNEFENALQDFTRVADLAEQQGRQNQYIGAVSKVWLAWAHCSLGDAGQGIARLSEMEEAGGEKFLEFPETKAHLHKVRAVCHFHAGDFQKSADELTASLNTFDLPGQIYSSTEKRIWLANTYAALAQFDEAETVLNRAKQRLDDLELAQHPLYDRIEATRQQLNILVNQEI